MPEEAIKQRLNRAIKAAVNCLNQPIGSYEIVFQSSGPFHLEAIRQKEIRKIRIVLDMVSINDEKEVARTRLPTVCTKEIWCKKINDRRFIVKEIL
jgi:hypothetical protein